MSRKDASRGLHACLQGFPGAVVEIAANGVVTDSNGKLEQLLGHQLVGLSFAGVLDATSQRKWARVLARETTTDGSVLELNVLSRDGIDLRSFAVIWTSDEPGETLWLLEYGRDRRFEPLYEQLSAANSELVRMQRALAKESARVAQALRVQEAAVRLRDDVLAIVAHDLRNPLDRMSASLALLLDETVDTESRARLLEVMERTVTGMNRLVSDLQDAANVDTGRLSLQRQRVGGALLIQNVYEMFQLQAAAKRVRLEWQAAGQVDVYADHGRLIQVLGNLLTNAIRLTPMGGEVVVRAELTGDAVTFSVSDTGPGILPEDVPFLFERFWQGRREDRGSAGLGLTIARGIVEGHGGRIWVESERGQGTTFSFTIPVARNEADRDGTTRVRGDDDDSAGTSLAPSNPAS